MSERQVVITAAEWAEVKALAARLTAARKAVSKFYDDHVIEGDPPCPCDACAMAREVFHTALREGPST